MTNTEDAIQIEFLGHINSHSVRNLVSLDKKLTFTTECVEGEAILKALANFLLSIPADQLLRFRLTLEDAG